jgi:type IV pilus biogenesis protein CpaD/CtpE
MVQKTILIVLTVLLLANCSSTKPIAIKTTPISTPVEQPLAPEPIQPLDITWKIIENDSIVYAGLTIPHYERLSLNMADIKRYIIQQQAIIDYYKNRTGDVK